MMMNPRITLRDVSKQYPDRESFPPVFRWSKVFASEPVNSEPRHWKTAVDRISLSIRMGERVGIVGRNGAGKSTLLSILGGVIEPSSGVIKIDGHVTSILTLGLGLREDLSGRENIYLDGEVQGRSRIEVGTVIEQIIAFTDIGEFIDYPVRTYSTGMKARLAFAMTFHIEPEILLIDEALSVGDAAFSVKATQKIRDLCNKGKIVILVSHSMESIVEICTRCLWMEDGQIMMDGDPIEVTSAYLESVRKKDEAVILERFRSHIGARSSREGCEITRMEVRQRSTLESRAIIKAGEDAEVYVTARVGVLQEPDLSLTITRLDGLVVTENRASDVSGEGPMSLNGLMSCAIGMRPVVLSPGIYRFIVELLDGDNAVAERSIIVEVIAERVPTGGRTALLYPCFVHAHAVLQ